MKRVALIVTGDMEKVALPASLETLFPNVSFEAQKTSSCTSARVTSTLVVGRRGVPTDFQKLARTIVASVDPGRKASSDERFDLVIAIDDLEIHNSDQPNVVSKRVADEVERYVAESDYWSNESRRDECRRRLRERASFHLLAPMPEAYFFGSPPALSRAGVTGPHQFNATVCDTEDFLVDDAQYAALHTKANAERHPKEYLKFLLKRDRDAAYRETDHGAKALGTLEWSTILSLRTDWARLARSFLCDLARGLDQSTAPFSGDEHPATSGSGTVLRNV